MNKAFANMSVEQIREYADMLDKAADDPNILKEMESMASFNNKEKSLLTSIQDGVSGKTPMDRSWVENLVKYIKENPKFFKTLLKGKGSSFGGITDAQMEAFIDTLSSLSSWFLIFTISSMIYIASLANPAKELYKKVDTYTFGMAHYIVLAIVLVILYYCTRLGFYFFRLFLTYMIIPLFVFIKSLVTGTGSIKNISSTNTNNMDNSNSKDEFAEF